MPKFKQGDLIIYNNELQGETVYLVLSYSIIMDAYKVIRPNTDTVLKYNREAVDSSYVLYEARNKKGHPLTNIFN